MGPPTVRRLVEWAREVVVFHGGSKEAGLPGEVRGPPGDRRRLADRVQELRSIEPDLMLDMVAMNESDARGLVEVFDYAAEGAALARAGASQDASGGEIGWRRESIWSERTM